MANMSYCRFENTSNDLKDCVDALSEMSPTDLSVLSSHEKRAADTMREQCETYIRLYDELLET